MFSINHNTINLNNINKKYIHSNQGDTDNNDSIKMDLLYNSNIYVSDYINLGIISQIMQGKSNTYFNQYFFDKFRDRILFLVLLSPNFKNLLENSINPHVTLFLLNSTEIKSFENIELSFLEIDETFKNVKDIDLSEKLLLSNYKRYHLIGYQTMDDSFFVLPQYESTYSEFKKFLENIIRNVSFTINKLKISHNLSDIKNIDIEKDLYLVYRIEFNPYNKND